jgi:hypothetical protein
MHVNHTQLHQQDPSSKSIWNPSSQNSNFFDFFIGTKHPCLRQQKKSLPVLTEAASVAWEYVSKLATVEFVSNQVADRAALTKLNATCIDHQVGVYEANKLI